MPSLIVNCRKSVEQVQVLQDISACPMRLRGVHVCWGAPKRIGDIAPQPGIDRAEVGAGNQKMYFMSANTSENAGGFSEPYLLQMVIPDGSYTASELAEAFNEQAESGVDVVQNYGVWTDTMSPVVPLNLRCRWDSNDELFEFWQVPSSTTGPPLDTITQSNLALGLPSPASYLDIIHNGSELEIRLIDDGSPGNWQDFAQVGDYVTLNNAFTPETFYYITAFRSSDTDGEADIAEIAYLPTMSFWAVGVTQYSNEGLNWTHNRQVDAAAVPRDASMPTFILAQGYTDGANGIPFDYTVPTGNSAIGIPAADAAILANYIFGIAAVAPANYWRVPGNIADVPTPPANLLRGDTPAWFTKREQEPEEEQEGALVDLSQLGASSREITGFSSNIGAHSYLYLPRPAFLSSPNAGLSNSTSYYMPLNLGFNANDVKRTFVIETKLDSKLGGECPFGQNNLNEFTLYFEYQSNDSPYG